MESGYVLNIHGRYGMEGSKKWEQEFIKKMTDIMHASKWNDRGENYSIKKL